MSSINSSHRGSIGDESSSIVSTSSTDAFPPPQTQHDQRQNGNGPSSSAAPFDLSSYARLMLQHTKQQLDATSALPPPPHIRVAGPLGHSQHQQRRQHSASLPNGTTPIMNGVATSRS